MLRGAVSPGTRLSLSFKAGSSMVVATTLISKQKPGRWTATPSLRGHPFSHGSGGRPLRPLPDRLRKSQLPLTAFTQDLWPEVVWPS